MFSDPYRLRCAEHDGYGHTAAVSSQSSSGILKYDCAGGFGRQMCHVSSAPVTWCGLPLGLVGSQSLGGAQMQCSSGGMGTHACPTEIDPTPDDKGGIFCKNRDDLKESRAVVASEVSRRVQGQPAGIEKDSETSNESGPLLVPKSARRVSGRRHHRLRMLADHLMCRDGKSDESLLERRAVRTLAARRNYQTALGSCLKFMQKCTLLLVADGVIDGALVAYSNDCLLLGVQHHQGFQLLAAVMDRWPSFSRFGSR